MAKEYIEREAAYEAACDAADEWDDAFENIFRGYNRIGDEMFGGDSHV